MMRKLIILVTIIGIAHSYAHAQKRKIEYGFRLGGGLSIQDINNASIIDNNSIRAFDANVVVSFPVLKDYYIRTSVGITNKGTMITEDALTTTNKITYYEFQGNMMRKYAVPTLGKIIAGVGFYYAMGDSGTLTYETPNSNTSNYISFGNDNDFKQFDGGISLITGLELNNHLTFNLGYDFGLSNIASQSLKDTGYKSVYNRQFSIMLGLSF
jgi:hypothetical protein